jgi:hypothetical protein
MASIYPAVKGLGKFLLGASPAGFLATGLFESKGLNAGEDEELQHLKEARGALFNSGSPPFPSSTLAQRPPFNTATSFVSEALAPPSSSPLTQDRASLIASSPTSPPFRAGVPEAPELKVPDNLKGFQYAPSPASSSSPLTSLLEALTTSRFRTGAELYRQAMPFLDYGLSKNIENLRKDYEHDLNEVMENPYLSARTRAAYLAAIHNKYDLGLKGLLADADYPSMVAGRIAPGLVEEKSGITSSSLPSLVKLLNYQQDYPYKLLRTLNLYQKTTGTSPLTLYQQMLQEQQQAKNLQKTIGSAVSTLFPKEDQGEQRNRLSIATYNTLQHIPGFDKLPPEQQQQAVQLAAQINHTLLSNQETGNLLPDILSGGLGAVLGLGVGKYSANRLAGNPALQKLVGFIPDKLRGHGLFSKVLPATLAGLAGLFGYAAVPDISSAPLEDVLNTKFDQDMTGQGILNAVLRGIPPGRNVVSDSGQLFNLSPSEQQVLQTHIDQLKRLSNSGQ